MGTKKPTVEVQSRELQILRTVFVTAFGAVILWAGNRLVSTSVSESRIVQRDGEIALINARIADIESHLRTNCQKAP